MLALNVKRLCDQKRVVCSDQPECVFLCLFSSVHLELAALEDVSEHFWKVLSERVEVSQTQIVELDILNHFEGVFSEDERTVIEVKVPEHCLKLAIAALAA